MQTSRAVLALPVALILAMTASPLIHAEENPPPSLTLPQLEALALQNNPTLAEAAAAIVHSRGMAQQAGLCPNPTVGYIGDLIGVSRTAGELQGVFIQQTIVTAGKLKLSRAKY